MIYISIKIRQFINSIPILQNEIVVVGVATRALRKVKNGDDKFTTDIQDKIFENKKIILTVRI